MIARWICQLVAVIPCVEFLCVRINVGDDPRLNLNHNYRKGQTMWWWGWSYLAAMVVAHRGGLRERIGERQIDVVQQRIAIQIEGESDFGCPVSHRIDGVQYSANDKHFAHLYPLSGMSQQAEAEEEDINRIIH